MITSFTGGTATNWEIGRRELRLENEIDWRMPQWNNPVVQDECGKDGDERMVSQLEDVRMTEKGFWKKWENLTLQLQTARKSLAAA